MKRFISRCHQADLDVRHELKFYDGVPYFSSVVCCKDCGRFMKHPNDMEAVLDE